MLKQSSNVLTDRSKELLLWSLLLIAFRICLSNYLFLAALDHLLGKGLPLGSFVCDVFLCFVTFPYGVLGQVWYLIVLIPNLCLLPYLTKAYIRKTKKHIFLSETSRHIALILCL